MVVKANITIKNLIQLYFSKSMGGPEFMNKYDKSRIKFLYNCGCLNQMSNKAIGKLIRFNFAIIEVVD